MRKIKLPAARAAGLTHGLTGLRALLSRLGASVAALWGWNPTAWGLPRGLALFLLVFVAGMLVISLVGDQGLVAYWLLRHEEQTLRRDVARLEARETELLREIDALRSDPAYIEQVARRELGFVRPGEVVVQLPAREEKK